MGAITIENVQRRATRLLYLKGKIYSERLKSFLRIPKRKIRYDSGLQDTKMTLITLIKINYSQCHITLVPGATNLRYTTTDTDAIVGEITSAQE